MPRYDVHAAEYFAAIKPRKWIRVVEGDTVPKTEFVGHRHVVIQDGGTEPIGNRVVEVPENETYTVMRDAESGHSALRNALQVRGQGRSCPSRVDDKNAALEIFG